MKNPYNRLYELESMIKRNRMRYASSAAVTLGIMFLVLGSVVAAQAQTQVTVPTVTAAKGKVVALKITVQAAPSPGIRDFQGKLTYDSRVATVQGIVGLNGYSIAAFQIDNPAGEVRFIGFKVSGDLVTQGEFLEIDMLAAGNPGDKTSLVLTFVTLNTPTASITHTVQNGQLTVTSPTALTADFSFSPAQPEVNQTIQFTDKSTGGGNINSWSWDFGDNATSTVQNPTHKYTRSGNYTVKLTVKDDQGTTNTVSKTVTVLERGGIPPVLVHVFPNPARTTATFKYSLPQNTTDATLYVFDVSGRQIYIKELTVTADTFQWNLKDTAGADVPDGAYYYVVQVTIQNRGTVSSSVGKLVIQR